jgi:uncharacterized protein YycO
MITRRLTLLGAAATLAACQTVPKPRDEVRNDLSEDTLQSGDLIFPRRPGARVIYKSASPSPRLSNERSLWEAGKAQALASGKAGRMDLREGDMKRLRATTYDDFLQDYSAPATAPGDGLSALGLTTGHVAIVVRDGDRLDVVEAVTSNLNRVDRRPYRAFAEEHRPDMLWQARLKGCTGQERDAFARSAASHTGKPYDFFNFDLTDDSSFYCSKLVWLAAWRSLGRAVDGDPNPRRGLWFSPKKLLNLSALEKIVVPGRY